METRCQKTGCMRPAAPKQKYCSREHSPLASAFDDKSGQYRTRRAEDFNPNPALLGRGSSSSAQPAAAPAQPNWARDLARDLGNAPGQALEPFDGKVGEFMREQRAADGVTVEDLNRKVGGKPGKKRKCTIELMESGKFDFVLRIFMLYARETGFSLDKLSRRVRVDTPEARKLERKRARIQAKIDRAQKELAELATKEGAPTK